MSRSVVTFGARIGFSSLPRSRVDECISPVLRTSFPKRLMAAGRIRAVLGEVLTAIVTPFQRDGSVDLDSFRALARHLVDERLRRSRRHRHDGREPRALRRGAARALRGRARRGRRPRDRRRRHRHVRHAALDPPDREGARARRRRVPDRDAVLHEAAAARNRRALQGGRGGHRPADRRLQHPEPRRDQPRAGDDRAARQDRERQRGQAGLRRSRGGEAHRRDSASTSTRATTT